MRIYLAAGHGGSDPGSSSKDPNNLVHERDESIKVVDQALSLIKNIDLKGNQINLVPHDLALREAVQWINKKPDSKEDVCIEVHFNNNDLTKSNGVPGTGTETYYGKKELAETLHKELVSVLGLRDRGVKDGMAFYFNNTTKFPSALIELGFINNPADLSTIRQLGAKALAQALLKVFGISSIVKENPVIAPEQEITSYTFFPYDANIKIIVEPLRIRRSPLINQTNIDGSFKKGTSISVVGFVEGQAPVGSDNNLWWQLIGKSSEGTALYVWSGGTDLIPKKPVPIIEPVKGQGSSGEFYTKEEYDAAMKDREKFWRETEELKEIIKQKDKEIEELKTYRPTTLSGVNDQASKQPEKPIQAEKTNVTPVAKFDFEWVMALFKIIPKKKEVN